MILIIAGAIFILIGLFFILSKKDPILVTKTDKPQSSNQNITGKDDKDKEVKVERSKPLEELVAPSNFPEVVFYFGS